MCHCIPKARILKKLKKEEAMRIPEDYPKTSARILYTSLWGILAESSENQNISSHDKIIILGALPILEVLQIPNKSFILKISILSQIYTTTVSNWTDYIHHIVKPCKKCKLSTFSNLYDKFFLQGVTKPEFIKAKLDYLLTYKIRIPTCV